MPAAASLAALLAFDVAPAIAWPTLPAVRPAAADMGYISHDWMKIVGSEIRNAVRTGMGVTEERQPSSRLGAAGVSALEPN